MAKLIYSALASVDGYIESDDGKFDWAQPDTEVHEFINELLRPVGTHLYGRRMYEVMSAWEALRERSDLPAAEREFAAIWHDSDKIVYSRTLAQVTTERTRLEREFEPTAVQGMKEAARMDLTVSGPELAAVAFAAGIVDEVHLFLVPVSVGSGKPALPKGLRLSLELLDQRQFGNGTVHLHYRPTR
ncbi:MAG: dihydrofolate reductase family protein [Trueperaceae bacterium]